jgi:hypothetical protein
MLEADFRAEYEIDIRDFWRPGGGRSKLSLRSVVSLIFKLPITSRIKQHFVAGRYDRKEHQTADIIDLLNQIAYYISVTAAGTIKDRKVMAKVHQNTPKRAKRPGEVEEKKQKKKFTSAAGAATMLNQWNRRVVIDHVKGCDPNSQDCSCPRRLAEKSKGG